ncbi:hypothetical protein ACELLULO517_27445 [Acidisoma cellulosilytica]|uniref:Uncharacterized protein n=1 Tax=Acidisoma cellulosilyticum TaxID=2802395 RepID=A0A963Z8W4_9PROT|nr:hypothetical protein [Acidisoma cellulosilyticum]MCB8884003.1 hypothetical protein [Acidisoma cellulosilyticum]
MSKADRAYARKRMLPSPDVKLPPPRRGRSSGRPVGLVGTFPLVDIDGHPDADLLKACAIATGLIDRHAPVLGSRLSPAETDTLTVAIDAIIRTQALTGIGVQMKAIFVMGDGNPMHCCSSIALYESVIRDFLRIGVAA